MTENKATNRKRKRKIRIDYRKAARSLALLVVIVWLLICLISPAVGAGTAYDRELLRASGDLSAEAPKIKASSAIMYSLDLDKPVYEKNADEQMPPYSITKLMTCYLALENLSPDEIVTASKNATKELEDGMEMELEPGEKHKAIDLIYASMLMSANDAATALGEAVAGSEKKFAKLMTDTAREWGCENTNFVNANGWDNKKHYTTARDMAVITKRCLENDELRKISMTKKYTVPASNMSEPLKIENAFLKTLGNYKVLTGGKTGSWSETQCAIALEFTDRGLSSVIVLLGDTQKGRAKDPKKLVEFAHDVTPGFLVTKKGDRICDAWVKHGAVTQVPLYAKNLVYAYPRSGKQGGVKVKTETDKLKAPVKKGDKAGRYYVYANDKLAGSGYLYAAEDVAEGWFPSYLYISDSESFVLLVIIILVAALELIIRKKPFGRSPSPSKKDVETRRAEARERARRNR